MATWCPDTAKLQVAREHKASMVELPETLTECNMQGKLQAASDPTSREESWKVRIRTPPVRKVNERHTTTISQRKWRRHPRTTNPMQPRFEASTPASKAWSCCLILKPEDGKKNFENNVLCEERSGKECLMREKDRCVDGLGRRAWLRTCLDEGWRDAADWLALEGERSRSGLVRFPYTLSLVLSREALFY
ncbi:hypothetical protein BCR34DRAFT_594823 [Clohesyomyces aquaticus]|uniref:Uncharacterized protein n=1 Tax=Clohesyomyces aquaticus TaxID=1231657 RepID=A0A1Y1Y469_9PLEO|nr:hypothetical protein BCR34DRAFT_594823 [Clohesyomyces aquaticus]